MRKHQSPPAARCQGIDPKHAQHLRRLLGGKAFVVLTANASNNQEETYEAWAYQGPLDFDAASPVRFGLGKNPVAALDALGYQLRKDRRCPYSRDDQTSVIRVNRRELSTILGALRFHQAENLQGSGEIPDQWILDIASNGGTLKPLSHAEVDDLCQKLNCGA